MRTMRNDERLIVYVIWGAVIIVVLIMIVAMFTSGAAPWDHSFNVCRKALQLDYIRDGYGRGEAWLLAKDAAPGFC